MPAVRIESIYGSIPKLAPFDRSRPPAPGSLALSLIGSDPSDGTMAYGNGCYAFAWYDGVRTPDSCLAYASCARNLLKIGCIEAVRDPDSARGRHGRIEIRPAKAVLHERDLAVDERTERLVLMETLVSLDDVMHGLYGLRVLGSAAKDSFQAILDEEGGKPCPT